MTGSGIIKRDILHIFKFPLRVSVWGKWDVAYRLLNSSFFLVQSMGGALLLERFWCASSLTCCSDKLSAGMLSVIRPWAERPIRDQDSTAGNGSHISQWNSPVTHLWRGVGGRGHQGGVGWGAGRRRADGQLGVPLSLCGPLSIHLNRQTDRLASVLTIITLVTIWTKKKQELVHYFGMWFVVSPG